LLLLADAQLSFALDRQNAGQIAFGLLDFAGRFQTLRGGLEAQMKEVLDHLFARQIQLFIGMPRNSAGFCIVTASVKRSAAG